MRASAARRWPSVLVACLAGSALLSEWLGQDGNYDLTNYHLYNGASLLRGWFSRDLIAAGMQSYFNPLLDWVYAALALGPLQAWPRLLAACMGLWAGLGAFAAWLLAGRLYPGRPGLALLATGLGVSGVAFASEIGTTFNDIPVADVMLVGLLAALSAPWRRRQAAGAGACFGVAAGLKLTAIVYAPAGLLAAAVMAGRRRLGATVGLFAAAWLGGWAATDGWWALKIWRRFDSPVFPLLNGVFRSPWYPPANFVDARFLPAGPLQALSYPLRWAFESTSVVGELPMHDPRGGLVLVLGAAAALAALLPHQRPMPAHHRGVLAFLGMGYAAWVCTTGILRYAIVLEVLSGLCIPLLLARLLAGRALAAGLAATLLLTVAATRYGGNGRVPYGSQVFQADTSWVRPGSLIVVTLRTPAAHLVALLPHPKQVSVVGLDFAVLDARGWRLHDEALRRVHAHTGPITVLTGLDESGRYAELGEIGLDPAVTNCRAVATSLVPLGPQGLYACDASRLDPARMPSPFWPQAAGRYRTVMQPQRTGDPLVGAAYLRAAGPAARGTRFLDWTDLLWNGVGHSHDQLPDRLDPTTLYVLAAGSVAAMRSRMDPARDALGTVDGLTVLAPGWLACAACTAALAPPPD